MRTVTATRYVTALREGGSLPGLVEADDDGLYVVKFRGAGQGPRALVAEWLGGELGRARRADRAGPRRASSSTRRSATPSRTRRSRTSSAPAAGSTSGLDFLPGRADVQPGRGDVARGDGPGDGGRDRLARRAHHEPGPDGPEPEPARLARPDLAASTTARRCTSTTRGATRTRTPGGRSSGSRDHVLLPFAGSIAEADARLAAPDRRGAARGARRADPRRLAARTTRSPATPTPSGGVRRATCSGGSRRRARSSRRPSVPVPPPDPRRPSATCSSTRSSGSCRASSAASSSTSA